VRLTGVGANLPHTYIHCTDKMGPDPFAAFAAQAAARGDRTQELSAGHFPMLTTPEELAALLIAG
jgi:hypothetical protein